MKYAYKISLSFFAGLLALATLSLPQQANAQRFGHPSFGGGGRSSAPPARTEAPRPAPAARPAAPVARPEPARPQPVENRPAAPAENRTINGGSRNFGNHDFHPAPAPAQQRVNVTARSHERVNVYHTNGYRDIHPYTYHPYHPYYWGPRWHPVGFFLSSLAATAVRLSIGNQFYYYDDGCYYLPSQGGYSAVPPPIGAVVSYLPDGYETTMVGNDTFYYYAGAFYINIDQGYQVVQAPPGAVISQLPIGAIDQQINGEDYMVYNNVYYAPISEDGQDAYQVVQP